MPSPRPAIGATDRVKQVQVRLLVGLRDVLRVRQPGHRVLGGEARDVVRRLHRLADRRFREIRRAGVAATLAQVDRHAQRLVAVAFHVLQLALAHRDAQAAAFGGLGPRVAGTKTAGMLQGLVNQPLKVGTGVAEAVAGLGGFGLHVGGYDTCR